MGPGPGRGEADAAVASLSSPFLPPKVDKLLLLPVKTSDRFDGREKPCAAIVE